jgi:hypothetical protein
MFIKKIIYTILFALLLNSCFSQIPNAGFENWTSMGSYSNPDSWGTMNNATALSGIFTATKGTPGSPGVSYLKLTSKTIASVVVNGIAVSGVLDSVTLLPKSGFSYSLRPQSITGKWQHMIYGTSQGAVSALLTRWNSALEKRDTVAFASQALSGMVMSWANFTIDFTYKSGNYPDTCIIVLKASGANPASDDYLWVDNMAFAGSVAGIAESTVLNSSAKTFPNPANSQIKIECSKTYNSGGKLIISDINGNTILEKPVMENIMEINTTDFANGIYFYKIIDTSAIQYSEGKFTVQH